MKTVERKVYYCDFCGRHRLTKSAIEKHEPKCVVNPGRVCGWCREDAHDYQALTFELRARNPLSEDDVAWLRDAVGGCPVCMLAAVVQSGLVGPDREAFDYPAEVDRFRKAERAEASPW